MKIIFQIINFAQLESEAYCDSWARFNNLIHLCSPCPFSGNKLLSYFHAGLDPQVWYFIYKMSGETIPNLKPEEAWKFLGNIADFEREEPAEMEKQWNECFPPTLANILPLDQCQTPIEDDEDDGIVVSEDEDGNLHFHCKREASEDDISEDEVEDEDDDESDPFEPSEEGHEPLLHIDGVEEDLDQGEQSGNLQALEEAFQHFTHITHTQAQQEEQMIDFLLLANGDEEGNTLNHSIRLFDLVISSPTCILSESFFAEKEVSLDDLLNLQESASLVPLRMEDKEEFPLLETHEEETIGDICLDETYLVPKCLFLPCCPIILVPFPRKMCIATFLTKNQGVFVNLCLILIFMLTILCGIIF